MTSSKSGNGEEENGIMSLYCDNIIACNLSQKWQPQFQFGLFRTRCQQADLRLDKFKNNIEIAVLIRKNIHQKLCLGKLKTELKHLQVKKGPKKKHGAKITMYTEFID